MAEIKLVTIKSPKSPVAEAYRTLRTNIQFSSFDSKIKTIVITSSGPGEGKTTASCNLAIATAQAGKRTILLDCDMRNAKIHKVFELSNQSGLSNVLIGDTNFYEAVQKTDIENLYVLPSGTRPPNPAELLSSEKMKKFLESLKDTYDYIIIDTPPIIMVTDAQILSQYADGCLFVIASAEADKHAVIRAKELLEKINAKILGVVLNKLDTKRKGYYGYYYNYYYGGNRGKHLRRDKKGEVSKKSNSKETVISQ